jgi:hypothetical protein
MQYETGDGFDSFFEMKASLSWEASCTTVVWW